MGDVSRMDNEIFNQINKVRNDPKSFVDYLKNVLNKFDGDVLKRDGKTNLRTNEGQRAV